MYEESDYKIKREFKFIILGAEEAQSDWQGRAYDYALQELDDIITSAKNLKRMIQPLADAQAESQEEEE